MAQATARTVKFGTADVTLAGHPVNVGDKAPDFTAVKNDLSEFRFGSTSGVRILVGVPSLETGVCDAEVRRFNQEAAGLPGVKIYTISMDLPFAQKRWCGAAGIEAVEVVSDHKDAAFATNYGVLMEGKRLVARSVFVVDSSGTIRYTEIVPVTGEHPHYEAGLAAARSAT